MSNRNRNTRVHQLKKSKKMKSLFQPTFALLVFVLLLTSCSIEKRVYLPGYHVTWKNTNSISTNQKSITSKNLNVDDLNIKLNIVTPETTNKTYDQLVSIKEYEDNFTASIENQKIDLLDKKINQLALAGKRKTIAETSEIYQTKKSKLETGINESSNNSEEAQKINGFALVGFILGIVGLLLMLIVGWPFFLGTLGIIFSAIGLAHATKGKDGKSLAIAGLVTSILAFLLFWLKVIILGALLF